MDKVLKRRLIGASILIALAVIFVPMLLVDPDSVRDGAGDAIDMPPMPDSAREVRRIPLDPEAARVSEPDRASTGRGDGQASSPGSEPAESAPASDRVTPDERIVLRPDLVEPEPSPSADASAADDPGSRPESGADSAADQAESADVSGPTESESETEAQAQPAPEPVETTEPAQMSTGDWVVQVASFGSQDAAEQVRARLEALGHIVARDEIVRGQSLLYRLRTGPYPSRAAADQALAQISATVAGVEPIVREIDADMQQGVQAGVGFAVQVGSFVSEENAESEAARLAGLGFESFRFSERIGERLIWRVMVGPVPERSQADALQSRVVEQAGVEGLVVSYP